VLIIASSCSFQAYGGDPHTATSNASMSETKVITIESVPISEYWFRKIFIGQSQMLPQEFTKSTIFARFESACSCVSDLHVQWQGSAKRDDPSSHTPSSPTCTHMHTTAMDSLAQATVRERDPVHSLGSASRLRVSTWTARQPVYTMGVVRERDPIQDTLLLIKPCAKMNHAPLRSTSR
jgi:hypothetical protein